MNGYIHLTHSKSKDEKHWPPNAGQQKLDRKVQRALEEKNTGEKRKHWPPNTGQQKLDTKVQRALEEKYWGEK